MVYGILYESDGPMPFVGREPKHDTKHAEDSYKGSAGSLTQTLKAIRGIVEEKHKDELPNHQSWLRDEAMEEEDEIVEEEDEDW
jgi:hypothetical protein